MIVKQIPTDFLRKLEINSITVINAEQNTPIHVDQRSMLTRSMETRYCSTSSIHNGNNFKFAIQAG